MLRALMASASGCITLSLALHATLLWGAFGQERLVEQQVAIDLTSIDGLDLELSAAREPARGGPSSAGQAPLVDGSDAVAARPSPRDEPPPRPERHEPTAAKAPATRQLERPPPPTPLASSPLPSPSVPASAAAPPTPSDRASADPLGSHSAAPRVVAAVPGNTPASGSGSSLASGSGAASTSSAASVEPGGGLGSAAGARSDAASRAVLRDYARRVRSRIAEQREYPYAARRARLHGTVCLRIELAATGRLLDVAPTCGGSLAPLAKAALAAVAKAAPFPPLPAALGQRLTLDVPVIFELED